MTFDFPLESVTVKVAGHPISRIANAHLCRPHLDVNESEFYLDVKNVAKYYARKGNEIIVQPCDGADMDSVRLFIGGSVLGAILHQQGILPFHGSSFGFQGKGVMICGMSGVGKSSVTAAFCQNGANFITDDITPVSIHDSATRIIPLKIPLKLWNDSIAKLNLKNDNLKKIRPTLDKFYLPVPPVFPEGQRLDHLFLLRTHNKEEFEVTELGGMEKYNALRKHIYRRIYLRGMPATERNYFKQLFLLAANVRVAQIVRPKVCDIRETMICIQNELIR